MARRGENIRKRTDGRWEGRYIISYSDNGKACYRSVYGKNYAEVKEKLKQHENCLNPNTNEKMSMKKLFQEWLEVKSDKIKPSSYVKYRNIIENHYIPYFSTIKTCLFTSRHIQNFVLEKNYLSEKTVHDMITLLLQIVRYGQSRQYINYFDFAVVICPKLPLQKVNVLKKSEIVQLVNYVHSSFEIQKIGVFLSLFMGIRLGEICALQWKDVNFSDEIIHIEKTMQRLPLYDEKADTKTHIVIDVPKSEKSIRDIPIPSFMLELLKQYKSDCETYILTGTLNYIEPTVYERMFKTYLKASGIEDTNFHTLRHTFATQAVEQGFDIKSLSELLGHSSVKFTMEKYVHPSDTHKKMNLEKMKVFY